MDGTRQAFRPGEYVRLFNGQIGMVIDPKTYELAMKSFKQGNKPGRYFAPGCCQNPDYVIQIPVLFEDGTYDVMRAISISRIETPPKEGKANIESLVEQLNP